MAALGVDSELRLVDRGEGEVAVHVAVVVAVAAGHRHAFGSAKEIARGRRHDPLFAGEQSNLPFALHGDDAVVDLAREQPQREADDARAVTAHPLYRQVCLAGVGRAEDGPDGCVGTARHNHECGIARAERKVPSTKGF